MEETPVTTEPVAAEPTQPTENMIPKSRFDEVNGKYRELEAQLATLQAEAEERRKADEAAALEQKEKQGEFEELYRKADGELATYKEKATTVEARAAQLETVINGLVEAELATIGEDLVDLIPDGMTPEAKLEWISKAKAKGLFGKKDVEIGTSKAGGDAKPPKVDTAKLSPLDKIVMGLGKK